jgi:hypothetical protein
VSPAVRRGWGFSSAAREPLRERGAAQAGERGGRDADRGDASRARNALSSGGFAQDALNSKLTQLEMRLDYPFLPDRQEWLLMDHRGNWKRMDESIGVPPVTVDEYRRVNLTW